MSQKTFQCPNCTCLNVLPHTDADGADVFCVHCKMPIHVGPTGKLTHATIAPRS